MPLGKRALCVVAVQFRQNAHVTPVVVAKQENDIIRHFHSLLVIFLNLFI